MEDVPCKKCLCLPMCIPPNNNYWCILEKPYKQGIVSHVEHTLPRKCDIINKYMSTGSIKKQRQCTMKARVWFSILVGGYKYKKRRKE